MDTKEIKMKKYTIAFTLFIMMLTTTVSYADKTDQKNKSKQNTEMIILDKGIKRTIPIPIEMTESAKTSSTGTKQVSSKKGIIIRFKKPSEIKIKEFEAKHGLKLEKKLMSGTYIFNNLSTESDIDTVRSIIKNESTVKTVKPNWEKRNLPR